MQFSSKMLSFVTLIFVFQMAHADAPPHKVKGSEPAPSKEEMAQMEAMKKVAKPGEEHKMLQGFVGTWNVETKWWLKPDQEAQISHGISTISPGLGGRFISEMSTANMADTKFEGMGLTGYSNQMKKYVASWADNMGTDIMMMTGTYDAGTKTYTYSTSYTDPTDNQKKTMKMTIKVVDKNKSVHEFWNETDGKAVKSMELTYTRAK